MSDENPMGQVIQIDEARIRDHLALPFWRIGFGFFFQCSRRSQ